MGTSPSPFKFGASRSAASRMIWSFLDVSKGLGLAECDVISPNTKETPWGRDQKRSKAMVYAASSNRTA